MTTIDKKAPENIPLRKKTDHFIISSERAFLDLRADFSESVKVTVDPYTEHTLNGWYLYGKTPEGNIMFIRKRPELDMIETIGCPIRFLQFDRNLGILPDPFHRDYKPVGPKREEFDGLRKKLTEVDEWE